MKKFQIYGTLALVALSVMLTSCFKNEEADIFDKSASERLEEAKKYYSDILTDKGGKWQMEYYANGDEHGYVYLMTFKKDGQVTIAGQNEYIGYELNPAAGGEKVYGEQTSLWDVIADNGPVLSFNSYNRIFHIFSSPYDVPPYGDNETDESGEGHLGDYEFDLMKYSNDTLYIEGKKHEIKMIMTRVDASTNDRVYMEYVTAMADSFFHRKMPIVFMNLPQGGRYGIMNGSTQMPTIWDFSKDRISYAETFTAIVNHDGFALMNPYTAGDYTVQRFVRNSDGSLRCMENPQITVDAGGLATDVLFNKSNIDKVELDSTYYNGWTINPNLFTGDLLTTYNAMKNDTNKGKRKLGAVSIVHLGVDQYNTAASLKGDNRDMTFKSYVLMIAVSPSASSTINVIMKLEPTFESEDVVTFGIGEATTTTGANLLTAIPSMAEFVNLLRGHKFNITAENLLAPTVMKLTDAANSGSSFVINVQ